MDGGEDLALDFLRELTLGSGVTLAARDGDDAHGSGAGGLREQQAGEDGEDAEDGEAGGEIEERGHIFREPDAGGSDFDVDDLADDKTSDDDEGCAGVEHLLAEGVVEEDGWSSRG